MGNHMRLQQNIVPFPSDKHERRKILRESKDKRVRITALLRKICGWLLAAAVFLFLLFNYKLLTPSSLRGLVQYTVAGLHRQSDITTIHYENGTFSDGALFAAGLAYADSDSLYLARPGGALSLRQPIGYASPVVETCSDYVLVYDRGGTGATLTNSASATAELTLESPIITGSLSPDGRFVLVTDEQGYRTAAAVYDTHGQEVLKYRSSEYYIVSAVLSGDGNSMAALAFRQNGVAAETHVLFYALDDGTLTADAVIPDALGMDLRFLSDNTAAALCDNGLYLISRKGKTTPLLDIPSGDLLAFTAQDSSLALAVRSYSNGARSDLYLLRGNGKPEGPFPLEEEPSALAVSQNGVAVLSASGVSVYDSNCTPLWQNSEAIGARRVLLTDDGTVFALYARNARLFTEHSERSEAIPYAN